MKNCNHCIYSKAVFFFCCCLWIVCHLVVQKKKKEKKNRRVTTQYVSCGVIYCVIAVIQMYSIFIIECQKKRKWEQLKKNHATKGYHFNINFQYRKLAHFFFSSFQCFRLQYFRSQCFRINLLLFPLKFPCARIERDRQIDQAYRLALTDFSSKKYFPSYFHIL